MVCSHRLLCQHISFLIWWLLILVLIISIILIRSYRCLLRKWSLRNCRWKTVWCRRLTRCIIRLMQLINIVHKHFIKQFLVLSIFWLVIIKPQICHPLLCLLSLLLRLLLLPLLLFLLLRLNSLELIEDVLIMQNSVRKLVPEVVLSKQFLYPLCNNWVAQDRVDIWTLLWVYIKHALQQIRYVFAKMAGHVVVLSHDDLPGELMETLGVEGRLERAHLVEQDAEGPDVGLEAVGLGLDDLGRQVVGRADHRLRLRLRLAQHARNTEVAQLYHVVLRQEDVLRLQVPVQYLSIVNVLQRQADLREPVQHVILAPILQLSARPLFLLVLLLDAALQVAAVGVVHNDAQLPLLGLVHFPEADDVRVLQHFQDLRLPQRLPPLILIHILDINLLDYCVLLVGLALHEIRRTEGANAQCLDFLVRLVLLFWLWLALHFFRIVFSKFYIAN